MPVAGLSTMAATALTDRGENSKTCPATELTQQQSGLTTKRVRFILLFTFFNFKNAVLLKENKRS